MATLKDYTRHYQNQIDRLIADPHVDRDFRDAEIKRLAGKLQKASTHFHKVKMGFKKLGRSYKQNPAPKKATSKPKHHRPNISFMDLVFRGDGAMEHSWCKHGRVVRPVREIRSQVGSWMVVLPEPLGRARCIQCGAFVGKKAMHRFQEHIRRGLIQIVLEKVWPDPDTLPEGGTDHAVSVHAFYQTKSEPVLEGVQQRDLEKDPIIELFMESNEVCRQIEVRQQANRPQRLKRPRRKKGKKKRDLERERTTATLRKEAIKAEHFSAIYRSR